MLRSDRLIGCGCELSFYHLHHRMMCTWLSWKSGVLLATCCYVVWFLICCKHCFKCTSSSILLLPNTTLFLHKLLCLSVDALQRISDMQTFLLVVLCLMTIFRRIEKWWFWQVRGLYRGATSSFIGVSFESSLLFGIYSRTKQSLQVCTDGIEALPKPLHFILNSLSFLNMSVMCIIVISPYWSLFLWLWREVTKMVGHGHK